MKLEHAVMLVTQMKSHTMAGLVGLCISIPLFLLTSWRLTFHFTRGNAPPTHWWTLRRRFHILLWCACLVEICAYADIAGVLFFLGTKISDKIGYVLLDLLGRSVFEFLAFSAVTELWLQTALQATPAPSRHFNGSLLIRTLNRVLGGVSVLVSTWLAFDLIVWNSHNTLVEIEKSGLLFRLQILMEAICWAVGAAFCVACIQINNERIQMNFSTFPPRDAIEGISLQSQALIPMIVCAVCYGLRSFFLLCRLIGQSPLFVATARFHPIWWIFFVWAPTLLVVLMALYSARRRDRNILLDRDADPTDPDNYAPLLPQVPPPAEAFRNFKQFADGIITPFGPFSPSNKESQTSPHRRASSSSSSRNNLEVTTGNLGDTTEI